jgi:transposase
MAGQPGFFDAAERLQALSVAGDPLERLAAAVDFGLFRAELDAALRRSDRSKGGRPPYDPVLMFRVLVLQTLYTLSDEQTGYQLRDRLSFMRFVGLALHEPVPDAKTVWLFREQLVRAGAVERLFARFDAALRERGLLAMGGQIVDATVVQARRARLTAEEKAAIRQGEEPEGWPPARRAQVDRDARWTLKRGRRRPPCRGRRIEAAGGGDRRAGVRLQEPPRHRPHARPDPHLDRDARGRARRRPARRAPGPGQHRERVWADTAYRSAANLELLARAAASAISSARSPGAGRCRATSPAATPPGARCGPRSSTCSPPRSGGSGW